MDAIPRSLLSEGLRRREPSGETGIDDFDLADYATKFQSSQRENTIYSPRVTDSYVTHSSGRLRAPTSPPRAEELEEYPPMPVISRPFSVDEYPSLYPPRSPSVAYSHEFPSPTQYPISPKSLPTFLAPLPLSTAARFATSQDSLPTSRTPDTDLDMDISHFPAYSRAWYEKPSLNNLQSGRHAGSSSKQSNHSGLPWDTNFGNGGSSAIDPITKRERIRMLEQDFGKDAEEAVRKTGSIVGSVDANGNLITSGPKKRALTRWSQALLALLGGASAIYGALVCLNTALCMHGCRILTHTSMNDTVHQTQVRTGATSFHSSCLCPLCRLRPKLLSLRLFIRLASVLRETKQGRPA